MTGWAHGDSGISSPNIEISGLVGFTMDSLAGGFKKIIFSPLQIGHDPI